MLFIIILFYFYCLIRHDHHSQSIMRYAHIEQEEGDDDYHADTYPLLFESVYDISIEQYIHDAIQLAGSQCQNRQKRKCRI